MSITKSSGNQDNSLTRDFLLAARHYLGSRRGLLALAAIAVLSGLALNWSWLIAAGVAPFLLGALPCVAMCALGLCMTRMGSKSCSTDAAPSTRPDISTCRKGERLMRNFVKTLTAAAALIASVALAPTLYAHDSGTSDEHSRSMMGSGMMEHGNMMNMMEQMSEMMANCNKMMQGAMNEGPDKPNEQWREDAPTAPGTND